METIRIKCESIGRILLLASAVVLFGGLSAMYNAAAAHAGDFVAECDDGIDNDLDGYIDYPSDSDCRGLADDLEGPPADLFREEVPYHNKISLSITDSKTFARPEENLEYNIVVRNRDHVTQTPDVRLQLPVQFTLHEVSGIHRKDGRNVVWDDVVLAPKEAREFIVRGHVERDVPDSFTLRLRVSTRDELATDSTTIRTDNGSKVLLRASVSDGLTATRVGDTIHYQVLLENTTSQLLTDLDVQASLPQYTTFVGADAGGNWTGNSVFWKNVTVSPHGKMVLNYSVHVRSDAPLGSDIRAGVVAAGHEAYDVTAIGNARLGGPVASAPVNSALLRRSMDKSEVHPGDTVTFTVQMRNTTGNVVRNVQVQDRFDANYLQVISAQGGEAKNGSMHWTIAELEPGQMWSASYTVRINPHTPHGQQIQSVVTAQGEGLQETRMTDLLTTGSINVITQLPNSGAGMDALFIALTAVLSIAPVGMNMRRKQSI